MSERCWWIVINSEKRSNEIFNSLEGAEGWQEDWGGEVVHVIETKKADHPLFSDGGAIKHAWVRRNRDVPDEINIFKIANAYNLSIEEVWDIVDNVRYDNNGGVEDD